VNLTAALYLQVNRPFGAAMGGQLSRGLRHLRRIRHLKSRTAHHRPILGAHGWRQR
jgi:hypothetical protein